VPVVNGLEENPMEIDRDEILQRVKEYKDYYFETVPDMHKKCRCPLDRSIHSMEAGLEHAYFLLDEIVDAVEDCDYVEAIYLLGVVEAIMLTSTLLMLEQTYAYRST